MQVSHSEIHHPYIGPNFDTGESVLRLWPKTLRVVSSNCHCATEDPNEKIITTSRLPDASISSELVTRDIRDISLVGAGGLEFLPYYVYGYGEASYRRLTAPVGSQGEPDYPDWDLYGFATPAYLSLFKDSLKAAREADILMDFPLGANQGQGVPAIPGTPGLAVQLLMGNATIGPGQTFSAPVPQAQMPIDIVRAGLQFMHPLEDFGNFNLTTVVAYELISCKRMTTDSSFAESLTS